MPVRLGRPLPLRADPGLALLSRCAGAGLRVPAGVVLLDDGTPPTSCLLDEHRPGALLTVRPVVDAPVPYDDAGALAAALTAAYAGGRDILVLHVPDAVHAGTARLGAQLDLVEAVEGDAENLLLGTAPEVRRLQVPVLRRWLQRPHRGGDEWCTPLPPWAMRLSRLLRGVRRVVEHSERMVEHGRQAVETCGQAVEHGERMVEWADDGRACWLLQVSSGTHLEG